MQFMIILALLIAIVAVVFALQNTMAVTVSFFTFNFHSSLALVVLVALMLGVLISVLVSLPGLISGKWTTFSQRRKLGSLEEERNALKQKAEEMEKAVKDLQDKLAGRLAEPVSPKPEQGASGAAGPDKDNPGQGRPEPAQPSNKINKA